MKTAQEKIYPIAKDNLITTDGRTNRFFLSTTQCQFEIFINDVLLFKVMGEITRNGGGVGSSYDINQLMLTSGVHEVKVKMYPKYGVMTFPKGVGFIRLGLSFFKDRDLRTKKYSSYLNGHNGVELSQSDKQWITKYSEEHREEYDGEYQPKKPLSLEGLPMYEWRSTFEAQLDMDLTGWRESVNLKEEYKDNDKALKAQLYKIYQKIYNYIADNDVAAYLALVKEREELITTALHYKENEKPLREQEFVKLIESDDYELQPLFEETFKLEYQAYGKLVMLLHKADGEGIIRLQNKKDPKDVIYLDFRFHQKKKDDDLMVI